MPAFPKPQFEYRYRRETETAALRAHARTRGIPRRRRDKLLLATWNIANLGTQHRRPNDYELLAEVCSWFDIVAIQEVNDNLTGLRALQAALPSRYRLLFSEASGNQERQAFAYDANKVTQLEKVGRLSIPPSQLKRIKPPGTDVPFEGFDRGPYVAAFEAGSFRFLLVNVHLFFGSDAADDMARRARETYAVAWWAERRQRSEHAFTKDIIPLGDFNLPALMPDDPILKALTARGLELGRLWNELKQKGMQFPDQHTSAIGGSNLGGQKHYDQIAFFPGETPELERVDVFDFDNAIFKGLWEKRTPKQFLAYLRYYISDHRPLWAEFDISGAQ
jgi:endonuclease/exonuclease/phosphatase family metal-dependent hydrolase